MVALSDTAKRKFGDTSRPEAQALLAWIEQADANTKISPSSPVNVGTEDTPQIIEGFVLHVKKDRIDQVETLIHQLDGVRDATIREAGNISIRGPLTALLRVLEDDAVLTALPAVQAIGPGRGDMPTKPLDPKNFEKAADDSPLDIGGNSWEVG